MTVAEAEPPDGTFNPMPEEELPLSSTVCGLSAALSAKVNVPVALPAAVGAKVTETVQVDEGPNVVPQLLVSLKGPLIPMWEICRDRLPELVNVTV